MIGIPFSKWFIQLIPHENRITWRFMQCCSLNKKQWKDCMGGRCFFSFFSTIPPMNAPVIMWNDCETKVFCQCYFVLCPEPRLFLHKHPSSLAPHCLGAYSAYFWNALLMGLWTNCILIWGQKYHVEIDIIMQRMLRALKFFETLWQEASLFCEAHSETRILSIKEYNLIPILLKGVA